MPGITVAKNLVDDGPSVSEAPKSGGVTTGVIMAL